MSDNEPQRIIVTAKTNGLAVAALVLGIIGTVFGLIPLTFFIAIVCGVLALIFGLIAYRAWRRDGERGRKGMAVAGTILGVVAIALGSWGAVIVDDAVDELDKNLNELVESP